MAAREKDESYYALLNVDKKASSEQINAAYRRLCIIYHPDKHEDMEKKTAAESLFSHLKEAHSVLSDPEKRIIYDNYGKKGLEASWEVATRTRTSSEIREEYERLQRMQEKERLQQATNPRGRTSVSIDATDLFENYEDDMYDDYHVARVGLGGISINQQVDAPLTSNDTLTLSATVLAKNGQGHGHITTMLRHVVTPSRWFEFDLATGTSLFFGGRMFMNLTRFTYGMAGLSFMSSHTGLRPLATVTLTRRLSDHTSGSLVWKSGAESSMTLSVVGDKENHRALLSFKLGFPDNCIRFSYAYKYSQDSRLQLGFKVGTMGISADYGIDTQISEQSWIGATMSICVPSGIKLKIKVIRGMQEFVFPIELTSNAIVPEAIFYGTVLPVAAYWAVKVFIVKPFLKQKEAKEVQEQQEAAAAMMAIRKQDAESSVRLMKDAYERSICVERGRHGLIIIEAWYGKLVGEQQQDQKKVIDVTVPLQCQVRDSKLILQTVSKSGLPGFYDPCVGEEKSLRVSYKFHDAMHDVTYKDTDAVAIPKQSHRIN